MSPRNKEIIKTSIKEAITSRWVRYPVVVILYILLLLTGCL